jgi:beta-lactamase class A
MVTASIVKLDILETLLHESSHGLSQDQAATARAMIEYSDNDAASELWAQVGRGDGLDRYNQRARLTSTRMDPYGHWGLTRTTPLDETRLMLQLVQPHVLRAGSARYALHLMRHVTPTQRWGVSAGAPAGVSVALKNGWLPVHDDYRNWTVNSVGYVAGAGTRYVIAILSSHDPSESYGIATVQHLSALVASVLQHRRERWVSKSTLPPFDPGDGSPQDGSRG